MTDLSELIERLKAATGPDRELDVDIAWSVEPKRYSAAYWNGRAGKPGTTLPLKLDGMGRASVRSNCPSLTASIDAALALVERCLPGWAYSTKVGGRQVEATVQSGEMEYHFWTLISRDGYGSFVSAPTLPLAILLALLTALQSLKDKS